MPSADPLAGAGRRILVVEDEFFVADYISALLEDLGYVVVGPVQTIPEALEMLANGQVDAALLDANLGKTSSAPIADELAARRLPFIVVTGYGNLELTAGAALQSAPRITKPFNPADFAAMLAKTVLA
jgi:CheY-like chemotaxis protein